MSELGNWLINKLIIEFVLYRNCNISKLFLSKLFFIKTVIERKCFNILQFRSNRQIEQSSEIKMFLLFL